MMIPPFVFSSSCTRLTITRSCRGRIFMGFLLACGVKGAVGTPGVRVPGGRNVTVFGCVSTLTGTTRWHSPPLVCRSSGQHDVQKEVRWMGQTGDDGKVLFAASVHDFFRQILSIAIENQRASVQQATELYLANLLGGFVQTESLLFRDENGILHQRPLALLLKDALDAEETVARARLLRRLGDTSLFVSGMFGECLNRSVVDVDYYIEMGGRAYDALGEVAARRGVERSLWDELSEKFSQLVEVLNEVAERTLLNSDTGLVRLYEKWMKTGSARVGVMLREQGVPAIVGVPRGRFVQRARRSTPSRNSSGYCSPSTDWKRRW